MSNFQKGDSVRLLHSKETGIITAILPNNQVRVLIDEILEMDLAETEICHAEVAKTIQPKTISTVSSFTLKDGIYFGLSLAKMGLVEIYLLNNTSYTLVYAAYRQQDSIVSGRTKGDIPPRQIRSLYSIRKAELETEGQILFQWLTFSTDSHKLILPQSVSIKLANRLFRKETQPIPGLSEPLIILPIQEIVLE
ncbi:MAG: DUF2027 domain-containing protein [Bacteroidia bacterium]|nr:DUF2027 domain-containing protein [Bacteroidia bacterium]